MRIFFLPLLLFALLIGGQPAWAASTLPAHTLFAFEEAFEAEEEGEGEEGEGEGEETALELAEEECGSAEVEFELEEISKAEADAICKEAKQAAKEEEAKRGTAGSSQCALRSAHAHAVDRGGSLKVTVNYTTTDPIAATIEVLAGAKHIVSVHHHLGSSGAIHISKKLGKRKVTRITVRFKTPSCKFQTKPVRVG